MEPTLIVVGGIIGALLVFAAMLLSGVGLIRWLGLPADPPPGAQYTPPAPPLVAPGDRAAARATAALQARRRELFQRAQALDGAGDAVIAKVTLEPADLDRADAELSALAAALASSKAATPDSHAGA